MTFRKIVKESDGRTETLEVVSEQAHVFRDNAARILDVHPDTITAYVRDGRLSQSRLGGYYVVDLLGFKLKDITKKRDKAARRAIK